MREGVKTRIHKEIASVFKALGDKEDELISLREKEENNPTNVQEAFNEVINNPDKEHKASETTISRLVKVAEKRKEIASFHENTLEKMRSQTLETEMEFFSDVQEFCTQQKKIIKQY